MANGRDVFFAVRSDALALLGPGATSDLSPKCAAEWPLAVSINEYAPWRRPASRARKQTVEISMKLYSFWRSLATYRERIALNLEGLVPAEKAFAARLTRGGFQNEPLAESGFRRIGPLAVIAIASVQGADFARVSPDRPRAAISGARLYGRGIVGKPACARLVWGVLLRVTLWIVQIRATMRLCYAPFGFPQ
jgi:hypothetical protein